jgi:hypothetical protein
MVPLALAQLAAIPPTSAQIVTGKVHHMANFLTILIQKAGVQHVRPEAGIPIIVTSLV